MEPISTYANNALIVAGSRKLSSNERKPGCRLAALEAVSRLQKRRPGPFSLNELFEEMQLGGSPYGLETVRRIALYDMSGRKSGTHRAYQDLTLRPDGQLEVFRGAE